MRLSYGILSLVNRCLGSGYMSKCGCGWEFSSDLMIKYHNEKWCKIEKDEDELFAMLVLETMQAGLSWSCVINKEEAIRKTFKGLAPRKVLSMPREEIEAAYENKDIIRNKRKIDAIFSNAKAFINIEEEFGSFYNYIWKFTEGKVIDHKLESLDKMPANNELSDLVSKDLKKRGFKFVGSTIIYSYLQAIGVINDHLISCSYR